MNRKHAYAGTTALHFAAEVGQVDVIRLLCAAGASVKAQKSTGGVPVHTAADANQSAAVVGFDDGAIDADVVFSQLSAELSITNFEYC